MDCSAQEEFEENFERPMREIAARSLYHTRRADDDTINSTRSLYDSDIVYKMLHGRRYCKDYFQPNDEEEQTRTQILHGIFYHILGQRLTTAPLVNPRKILDIGTGTGDWAMQIAEEYPDAEVIGTDIAKIQPNAVPLNVFFEIDDAEEEGGWTWPEDEFDFIHCRSLQGAFRDWTYVYKEAFRHLKPGGWIEVIDYDDHRVLMSYFEEYPVVAQWLKAIQEAALLSGRPKTATHLEPQSLTALGFVDVTSLNKTMPMGVWPEDPEERKIGTHVLVSQLAGIEGLSLRPLVETLGRDIDETRKMLDAVADVVRSISLDPEKGKGIGFNVKFLIGRKPDGTTRDDSSVAATNVSSDTA